MRAIRTAVFVDDGSTGAGIDECRLARVDAGATAREGAAALADGLGLHGSLGNDSTGEEGLPGDDSADEDGLVGGVVGGDDPTPTPTPTADDGPTPTSTPTGDGPTPTPTDDGLGIL